MRQNLGHTKTSIGSTLGQKLSKLSGSPGSQFVGFDADRNRWRWCLAILIISDIIPASLLIAGDLHPLVKDPLHHPPCWGMGGWAEDNIGGSGQDILNIWFIISVYRLASHIKFEDQHTKEYKNKQPRPTVTTGIFQVGNIISCLLDKKSYPFHLIRKH